MAAYTSCQGAGWWSLPGARHARSCNLAIDATVAAVADGSRAGLASSPERFRPAGGRALANLDQLLTREPLGAGKCLLAGELVETPPVSGPKFRSAGRRPFQNFRNSGLRLSNFDTSTSLRALFQSDTPHGKPNQMKADVDACQGRHGPYENGMMSMIRCVPRLSQYKGYRSAISTVQPMVPHGRQASTCKDIV
jgi:hypothetical protein